MLIIIKINIRILIVDHLQFVIQESHCFYLVSQLVFLDYCCFGFRLGDAR